MTFFNNRNEAGEALAEKLSVLKPVLFDPIVLGIPRGGIPIGYYIASILDAHLDAIVLRKLPIPDDPEAGFGAVTLDKIAVLNKPLLSRLNLTQNEIENIVDTVYNEVLRRNTLYRKNRPFPDIAGSSVILTDDGLASGYTMLAGIRFIKERKAREVIAAVPVAHDEAYNLVKKEADRVITLYISTAPVFAVASFYKDFADMSDKQVANYLENGY